MKKKMRIGGLLTVISFVLSGCSAFSMGADEYSCSGMPNGVQCMSARDVYKATNDGAVPLPMKKSPTDHKANIKSAVSTSSSSGNTVIDNYIAPRIPNKPIPIRTPAKVMRIWIAPWEDKKGDLIVPGYVYTEIEPRRWVIGERLPTSDLNLQPLQSINLKSK